MPSITLSVGGGIFAMSSAVEKRSIRLPNWWLTWRGWGEEGKRGEGKRREGKRGEGMTTRSQERKETEWTREGWEEGLRGSGWEV